MKQFSRIDAAKALGRRISRGEFERMFTRYLVHKVIIQSNSKGRQTGKWNLTRTLDPQSPKFKRKHSDTLTQTKSRRARFI